MRFCEKLTKIRKEKNLSQEALAEKLGMSRQAISKWESGNSYPDMATLIKVAKVLDCTLEDIIDDDAIGNNKFEKNDKFNINKWIKEILDFITRTYNMFWSMKFKEKIKCIFELAIIVLILFLTSTLVSIFLKETIFQIFTFLPYPIYSYFSSIFKMLYVIFATIISTIIFIHLFKIRYLDYYVTVEDDEVEEKQIEKDKTENKNSNNKVYKEKKQEKIIIRDPKHTTYSFFSGLGKIVMFLLKLIVIFILFVAVLSFIFLSFSATVSVICLKYGLCFLGILIFVIGLLSINYCFIELMYRFIFNNRYNFKRIFIIFIIGLLVSGIGTGITFTEISKFDYKDDYKNVVLKLKMKDNLIYDELEYYSYDDKVIIDNSVNDILISVDYIEGYTPVLRESYENTYYVDVEVNNFNIIKEVLNDIKNKKIKNYSSYPYVIKSITLSQKNYNMIKDNIKLNNE